MKVRISYIETYLLKKRSKGLGCGLDIRGCGTRIVARVDRSSSHLILSGILGSGIDDRRVLIWQKNIQTRIFIE